MITDEQDEEISGLDGEVFSLISFQRASDPYPSIEFIDEDLARTVSENFFSITTLFYQGILLMGKTKENENQSYGFVPEYQGTPFFLADDIFQFFNTRITVVQ